MPTAEPRVAAALTVPSAPVTALAGVTLAPSGALNATGMPRTGRPMSSLTFTVSGTVSAAPGGADCPSPDAAAMADQSGSGKFAKGVPAVPSGTALPAAPTAGSSTRSSSRATPARTRETLPGVPPLGMSRLG